MKSQYVRGTLYGVRIGKTEVMRGAGRKNVPFSHIAYDRRGLHIRKGR